MSEEVGWIVEVTIKEGQAEAFKSLSRDMISSTTAESGTLQYEWQTSRDNERDVIIIERYQDSDSALIHTATFAEKFAVRFNEVFDQTRLLVYGNPSKPLRDVLLNAGGTMTTPIGGFRR